MNVNEDRFCDQCGAANRSVSKFCSRCGSRLPTIPSTSSSSSPSPYSTRNLSTSSHVTGLLNPATLLKQRYRIVRKIGQGGFSAVYQAEDLVFNAAPRVVKEMSMQASGSQPLDPLEIQQAITSFQQEALLLAGLTHPNLPRIYDYFEQQQRWYIVMDYINGQTLEERLAQAPGGKLSLGQVLPFAQQLCNILAYLHSQQPQIIFRDLKPANIMVTADDHVYLIDFGIARLFKPGQANDTVALGSPGYAAPEQYGRSQSTSLSDIYSLGATLHHLLSGQDPSATPFQFASLTMLHGEPGGPAVGALIECMVQIPQNLRPQTIQEVKQVLQRGPGTSPVAPSPANAGQASPMSSGIGGATVIVAKAGGDYASISEALQKVPEKTRILIRPGAYQENLVLEKQVELVGDGPRDQIILLNYWDSCIQMSTNTALVQGVTIKGHALHKATIDIPQGRLVLSECTITSTPDASIHIHNQNTRPLIQRCIIRDSHIGIFVSEQGGGIIEDCDIFASTYAGIVVKMGGTPLIRGCKIHDGKETGISVFEQGTGSFENCEIFANVSAGIYVTTGGSPSVRGCKIHEGQNAGIIVAEQGMGTFEDCDIYANAQPGIAVQRGGVPVVRRCQVHDGQFAGIFVTEQGRGTFENCDIFGNEGPGIAVTTEGAPVVRGCEIHDGKANGITVTEQGKGTFETCDIYANASPNIAVAKGGAPVVQNCQIHHSKQVGIYVIEQGLGVFRDCRIYANDQAGISVQTGGAPLVRNCKIHDGKAAGIFVLEQGKGTFENCDIFAHTFPGINVTTGGAPLVRNCKIHDGKGNGIHVTEHGAGTFEDCDIFAHTFPGISVTRGGAPLVRNCKIHDNKDAGIYVADRGQGTFNDNETFANKNGGVLIGREGYPVIRQCRFWDGKKHQ